MISGLFLVHWAEAEGLYAHSEVLLYRQYHNDLPHPQVLFSKFDLVYKLQEEYERTPFISVDGINFAYIPGDNGIFVVVVSRRNIDAMLAVLFLHQFYGTLCHYLCDTNTGGDSGSENNKPRLQKLHKDTIIDNFNLVYELFDECMDYGIVQLTDYNILKEYIKVEANRPKIVGVESMNADSSSDSSSDEETTKKKKNKNKNKGKTIKEHKDVKSTHNQAVKTDVISPESTYINSSILRSSALSISWRPKGIFYAKNEIFIDMIESCEFAYDLESQFIKRNEIRGVCDVKCYLSGMPLCNLGFNETKISGIASSDDYDLEGNQLANVEVEDAEEEQTSAKEHTRVPISNVQFHQCVDLSTVYRNNIIKFIPADHKFTLMSYRVEQQKQRRKLPLIMLKPTYVVNTGEKTLQVMCELSTHFKKRLRANNIQIVLPIDPHIFSPLASNPDFKYKAQLGDVSYKIDSSQLLWNIESLVGSQSSVKMMAQLNLDSCLETNELFSYIRRENTEFKNQPEPQENEADIDSLDQFYGVNGASSSLAPKLHDLSKKMRNFSDINVRFTIPMLSYLGLKITYVKVEEEQMKYTCFPWIRYLTQSNYDTSLSQTNMSSNYIFNLGPSSFQVI